MASFLAELRRRKVFRVAAAYAVVAWVLIQVADTVFPALQLPMWTVTFVVVVLLLGFPVALLLSWAYDFTAAGIERTESLPSEQSPGAAPRAPLVMVGIVGVLVLAVGYFVLDSYFLEPPSSTLDTRPSIAVLPFSNLSESSENAEFLASGIHDDLLTQLAKIGSLKVISRTSVLEYRDTAKNLRQIGQELGVTTILEGGVQRAGDTVRINVQLIDAETDEHLWAETYDRELTPENIFAIQGEMAVAITGQLEAALSPEEADWINEVPTRNARAYEFFLTGNEYARRPNERVSMPIAVQSYQRAVEEDPEFAVAWAALSEAHSQIFQVGGDPSEERRAMAEAALERAVALAPDAPETRLARGHYYSMTLTDFETAIAEYEIVEQRAPGSAPVLFALGGTLRRAGRWDESIVYRERALALDPRNVDQLISQASTYARLKDYGRAEALLDRAQEVTPDSAQVLWFKANLLMFRDGDVSAMREAAANPPFELGRLRSVMGWMSALYDRDYETALRHLDGAPLNPRRLELELGETYRLLEQPELARPHFEEARRLNEESLSTYPDDPAAHIRLGWALAGLGESEEAVRMGRQAMALMSDSRDAMNGADVRRATIFRVFLPAGATDLVIQELDTLLDGPTWWSIEGMLPDPRLDVVRDDPRFQALVEKYSRP